MYKEMLAQVKDYRTDSIQRFNVVEKKLARVTSLTVHFNHDTYNGMNDENFNSSHFIQLKMEPGKKRPSAGFSYDSPSSKLIKLEQEPDSIVISSDEEEQLGSLFNPKPRQKKSTVPKSTFQQSKTQNEQNYEPGFELESFREPFSVEPPVNQPARKIFVNPNHPNGGVAVPMSDLSDRSSLYTRFSLSSKKKTSEANYLGFDNDSGRWPSSSYNDGGSQCSRKSTSSQGPKVSLLFFFSLKT